ncbi:MAG: CDP-6-deoxy-L-threo-D-glycero-4-hexulose-3-dehydrase reductase [Legionellaceae bacterium]
MNLSNNHLLLSPEKSIYPLKQVAYKVEMLNQLTSTIYQVFLLPLTEEKIQYQAGQYLEIVSPDGIARPFSIANAPVKNGLIELHIRHFPGNPYTEQIIKQITQTGIVNIKGPYGKMILHTEPNYPFIFIAGGTGFAPIKALIESSLMHFPEKLMYLYWGVRTLEDLYLADLPKQWINLQPHFKFIPIISTQLEDLTWQGRHGFIHDVLLTDHSDLAHFHIYAAGPTEMVYSILHECNKIGLNKDLMYSDVFNTQ